MAFKSELNASVYRDKKSKEMMVITIPIIYGIVITIGLSIISLLPSARYFNWVLKILLVLVFVLLMYYSFKKSRLIHKYIYNIAHHIKMIAENGNF